MWFVTVIAAVAALHLTGAQHPCDNIPGDYNSWITGAQNIDVVIVGAGVAGLSAARELYTNSTANFVILEAQDYIGGRVKTTRIDHPAGTNGKLLVEDGAEWIHAGQTNPLYQLADQRGQLTQPLSDLAYDWRAKTSQGENADEAGYDAIRKVFDDCEVDAILRQYYDATYTEGYGLCYEERFNASYINAQAYPSQGDAWLNYLHMWVNKDMGSTDWKEVSARDADRFTDYGADQWNQWVDGYDFVVKYLMENTDIESRVKTQSPVCKIKWDGVNSIDQVLVVTKSGESYLTKQVIFTGSVGHLKERHTFLFDPQLPQAYQNALNRMELGIANKVQLGWSAPWWNPNKPLNLHIIFKEKLTGDKAWLGGIMEFLTIHQQGNLLQAFMAGENALAMENLSETQVKNHVVEHLAKVTGQNVPEPIFFRRSKWYANPWTRGSYNSFVSTDGDNAGLRNRLPDIAKPLVNSNNKKVLRWAGEHLSRTRYGTVDGAIDIGAIQAGIFIDGDSTFWKN